MRVGRPCHRLPREAGTAPWSLEVSEARLEQAGIVECVHGQVMFQVIANPNHSVILQQWSVSPFSMLLASLFPSLTRI